jgi:hypothetical protein
MTRILGIGAATSRMIEVRSNMSLPVPRRMCRDSATMVGQGPVSSAGARGALGAHGVHEARDDRRRLAKATQRERPFNHSRPGLASRVVHSTDECRLQAYR